jgi:hypothetical protein
MTERQVVLERMKKIEDYFQYNSLRNVLFHPEFVCASIIREKSEVAEFLTNKNAEDILKVYNETNAGDHYDGSGWQDYQLHLINLLTIDGFDIQFDNSSGHMRISTS